RCLCGPRRRGGGRGDGGARAGRGGPGQVRRGLGRRDPPQRAGLPGPPARAWAGPGPVMSPRVILVGLPGTGKSTTGRRLAKMLVVPFADSDDLVEQATGRTVREIFAEDGEITFRGLEA